jgi:THUMP domain-like/RNA cap guanine-N2 methyltransferase
LDLITFQQLLTPTGQAALVQAAALEPTEETFLTSLTQLQKQVASDLAKAALETVIFRHKAQLKFTRASSMYFTREGLEMASGEIISRYRAQRFAPFQTIADLCCGVGGDTLGLADGHTVTAVDLFPLHLALAQANLAAYGLDGSFVEQDLTKAAPPAAEAYFFDPGRRAAGKRLFSVRQYQPPLDSVQGWLPAPLGVKISPGVQLNELDPYDCEIEFISLDGDLKECVLWFGPFKTASKRATLLTSTGEGHTFVSPSVNTSPEPSQPKAYLYEPDPAILRAGLVVPLALELGAVQLDEDIAYLTSDTLKPTPFAQAFAIEASLPFSQKRLREKLRAMQVGRVTIKKRGSPLDPATFARSLKLSGPEERIVFLTHVQGQPWALIGTRL